MPELGWEFGVLGPLTVTRNAQPVTLSAGRQRLVLGILLKAGGEPISRDRLIDAVWGERPPQTAVSALHVHLSKLRAQLDGLIESDGSGYRLKSAAYTLDAAAFEDLLHRARADPDRAPELLAQALGLWRGDPLADLAAEGPIAEWQRELSEKRLAARIYKVDAELAAGATTELVPEIEQLLVENPYEERAWGQLMLALYRSGRQAEALDAYGRARRVLADELGLEPGAQLRRLQRRILDHDPTLAPGRAPSDESGQLAGPAADLARPGRRSNLPQPLRQVIGREGELAALSGLLADPDARLITLVGPGGVGKTRLLIELARAHEHTYADGAAFVRLDRLTDPSLVLPEIAAAISTRDGTDGLDADGLRDYLRDRELLLALDNFEQLMDGAVALSELVVGAPRVRIVVSSRAPLRVRGERVFDVEPLRLPAGDSEAERAASPAVQLYLECALAADRDLVIDVATTRTVAEICRGLDGLPLAIELAAARSQQLSPSRIAGQLAQPLSIGRGALRDLPGRQQTLEATIGWSYDLLTPDAQAALRAAGVFVGGFTGEGLEAVLGAAAVEAVDELLETRMARRQAIDGRYELLVLVRSFALQKAEATGDLDRHRAAHGRYFAALVEPAAEAFSAGTAPGEVAAPLLPDHANLREALTYAISTGDAETAVALWRGMRALWFRLMARIEATELAERIISELELTPAEELDVIRIAAFLSGFGGSGATWNRRMADVAKRVGDDRQYALAMFNLFAMAVSKLDRETMAELLPAVEATLTPDAAPMILAWGHYQLANYAYIEARFEECLMLAREAEARATAEGHDFAIAGAAGLGLLAQSAQEGVLRHGDLMRVLQLCRAPAIKPLTAAALWLVSRYAAEVAPEDALVLLAHAERLKQEGGENLWPEAFPGDETVTLLGVHDLEALIESTPALDHVAALDAAISWLATRDPEESVPRDRELAALTVRAAPAPS